MSTEKAIEWFTLQCRDSPMTLWYKVGRNNTESLIDAKYT